MHISEGVLNGPTLAAGAVLAIGGTAMGLRHLRESEIPRVAILSAAFYVASLVHIPSGVTSVHLILNGLLGVLLGWRAFPAILVALLLQAVMFQFGGLTTLGVNTVMMAAPAVLCHYLYRLFIDGGARFRLTGAFLAGALGVLGSGVILASALWASGDAFVPIAKLALLAHVPVAVIEGAVTAFCIASLARLRPEMLPAGSETERKPDEAIS